MKPSDEALTQNGLAPDGKGEVLILACGALAREILSLTAQMQHVSLACLPAILHNHPDQITARVEEAVAKHRNSFHKIFVAYADCGTGGHLQAACDRLGIEMISGPHCYSFFEGNERFKELSETEFATFYLTDFLVRQFDAFVTKPLGLDRHPELRDMYFGNYEKLVYQAQTDDPALTELAKSCAERLGLAFERRFTGYGDLATALENL